MRYLVAMIVVGVTGILLGEQIGIKKGIAEGRSIATKEALRTNPPSQELEMVCAGLWIGEQNKKYWEKRNASKSK